ncbi:hypothetical protein KXD40_003086 [Peronospora effusa]|nr:hypothetical protein KXD40_003086 [Peronospora effusa]
MGPEAMLRLLASCHHQRAPMNTLRGVQIGSPSAWGTGKTRRENQFSMLFAQYTKVMRDKHHTVT